LAAHHDSNKIPHIANGLFHFLLAIYLHASAECSECTFSALLPERDMLINSL